LKICSRGHQHYFLSTGSDGQYEISITSPTFTDLKSNINFAFGDTNTQQANSRQIAVRRIRSGQYFV